MLIEIEPSVDGRLGVLGHLGSAGISPLQNLHNW